MTDQKQCPKCLQIKNLSEFNSHFSKKLQKRGFSSYCRKCNKVRLNEYNKSNPEKLRESCERSKEKHPHSVKERSARWYKKDPERAKGFRLRKYWPGVSWQEALVNYNKMFTDQDGLCLFCKRPETSRDRYGGTKSLAVDHDHITKKARGLLCNSCNVAFGSIKESIEAIQNMLNYAKKHQHSDPD